MVFWRSAVRGRQLAIYLLHPNGGDSGSAALQDGDLAFLEKMLHDEP